MINFFYFSTRWSLHLIEVPLMRIYSICFCGENDKEKYQYFLVGEKKKKCLIWSYERGFSMKKVLNQLFFHDMFYGIIQSLDDFQISGTFYLLVLCFRCLSESFFQSKDIN